MSRTCTGYMFFFFNDTATTEIYTLSLHDALPIFYSTGLGDGGPTSATFNVDKLEGVELVGKLTPRGKEIAMMDPLFGMKVRYFEHNVQFVQKIKFTKPNYLIEAYLEYGSCNDETCLPPTAVELKQKGKSPAIAADNQEKKTADEEENLGKMMEEGEAIAELAQQQRADSLARVDSLASLQNNPSSSLTTNEKSLWWQPVVDQLKQFGGADDIASHGLLYIFFMGLVGGLLALVMPCIWPIIPMTVSFFLKRAKDDRKKGIKDAITYGVSIIVIYLGLGLLVTSIAGPSTLRSE